MKKLMALLLALLTCFAAALADTASAPDIPQGTLNAEVMPFTPGQTYAVYSAPDSRSIRGAKGRARVSTNGWIQVFGTEGDWLLVQYAITPEHCRIGYIDRNALPQDVVVPALTLEAVPAIVSYDVSVTDDPLMSQTPLTRLTENTSVTALASMGDWTYIEAGTGKSRFRGFVPTECLLGTVNDTREANRAILGSWKLYVGSSVDAEQMTFLADGSMTGCAVLADGTRADFCGTWEIQEYDTRRERYWNDSEFELTLSRGSTAEQYGLRICRRMTADGGYKYALILSDGTKESSMVLE